MNLSQTELQTQYKHDQFILVQYTDDVMKLIYACARGVDSVAPFITVNEQSESIPDCSFHSSIAYFASGRSYHQNLITFTRHRFADDVTFTQHHATGN